MKFKLLHRPLVDLHDRLVLRNKSQKKRWNKRINRFQEQNDGFQKSERADRKRWELRNL